MVKGVLMSDDRKEKTGQPVEKQIAQTVAIQNIYFNGFVLGLSNSDVNALLLLDGQPTGRLSMSFTTAKTLVKLLDELVSKLESVTNHTIMTHDEVAAGLQKLSKQSE